VKKRAMVRGTKRAMVKATMKRAMATAMKRAMATDGDNMGKGYGEEGGGRLTVAMMLMAQRTWLLALQLERGG
jgi:hypothetical protein